MSKDIVKSDEKVKIINGVFKGISGYIRKIDMSTDENTIIHIEVDHRNIIVVDSKDIEVLYDDYLIYKTKADTGMPVEILGIYRLEKSKIDDFLMNKFRSCCPSYFEFESILKPNNFLTHVYHCDYCMSAIPVSNVKFDFNGMKISIEELKKILP